MNNGKLPRTPAQVAPYVEVLGVAGAIEFLLTFGGAELYLTPSPARRSRLVDLVGYEKAVALARVGEHLPARVPLMKPWIAKVWYAEGLKKAEIARRLHVTDVTVRTWIAETKAARDIDPRQPDLPLF